MIARTWFGAVPLSAMPANGEDVVRGIKGVEPAGPSQ